jgi:hypothetical protein
VHVLTLFASWCQVFKLYNTDIFQNIYPQLFAIKVALDFDGGIISMLTKVVYLRAALI